MPYSFLIINDDLADGQALLKLFANFPNYTCAGIIKNTPDAIEQIMKNVSQLVLIDVSMEMGLSFSMIRDMFQYVTVMPYIIATSKNKDNALEAIQSGISDYLIEPLQLHLLGKSLFRFEKLNTEKSPVSICIKSYSDYHFIVLQEIMYLKADNNTTDIHLNNGKVVTAYKTLKHFEAALPNYFARIHKSYIVNIHFVSRIHFSKSKCYLNYNEILPFTANYRTNIDAIIQNTNL